MQERRRVQRKNLMAYSQVFDLYSGYLLGYLGDLHLHGAMVIGEKPMTENSELTLAIELPELPGIAASRITVPARVVWCQPDISPEFFNIGFEFKEVTIEHSQVIEAIVENYEFRRIPPGYTIKPSAGK
ncbi:MAG: PilZ domain-containing protein [Anaerolineales bacterium]|nr:PilZ domain-containing protein [Anaerolineales bacterium]